MGKEKGISHGLGFGNGSIIEYDGGVIEYRQTGKVLPAFRVNIADVTGFSVRKATREDKKNGASAFQQMLVVLGQGTELASCAMNYGTAQKIEDWVRAHPAFGSSAPESTPAAAPVLDLAAQIAQLSDLRAQGVLSDDEFAAAKARLLGGE